MEGFLPSEIARLVLGYLKEIDCMRSYQVFLEECDSLQEYVNLLRMGREYTTKINGLTLREMLEDYAHLKELKSQSTCDYSLWQRLDSLIFQLRHGYKTVQQTSPMVTMETTPKRLQENTSCPRTDSPSVVVEITPKQLQQSTSFTQVISPSVTMETMPKRLQQTTSCSQTVSSPVIMETSPKRLQSTNCIQTVFSPVVVETTPKLQQSTNYTQTVSPVVSIETTPKLQQSTNYTQTVSPVVSIETTPKLQQSTNYTQTVSSPVTIETTPKRLQQSTNCAQTVSSPVAIETISKRLQQSTNCTQTVSPPVVIETTPKQLQQSTNFTQTVSPPITMETTPKQFQQSTNCTQTVSSPVAMETTSKPLPQSTNCTQTSPVHENTASCEEGMETIGACVPLVESGSLHYCPRQTSRTRYKMKNMINEKMFTVTYMPPTGKSQDLITKEPDQYSATRKRVLYHMETDAENQVDIRRQNDALIDTQSHINTDAYSTVTTNTRNYIEKHAERPVGVNIHDIQNKINVNTENLVNTETQKSVNFERQNDTDINTRFNNDIDMIDAQSELMGAGTCAQDIGGDTHSEHISGDTHTEDLCVGAGTEDAGIDTHAQLMGSDPPQQTRHLNEESGPSVNKTDDKFRCMRRLLSTGTESAINSNACVSLPVVVKSTYPAPSLKLTLKKTENPALRVGIEKVLEHAGKQVINLSGKISAVGGASCVSRCLSIPAGTVVNSVRNVSPRLSVPFRTSQQQVNISASSNLRRHARGRPRTRRTQSNPVTLVTIAPSPANRSSNILASSGGITILPSTYVTSTTPTNLTVIPDTSVAAVAAVSRAAVSVSSPAEGAETINIIRQSWQAATKGTNTVSMVSVKEAGKSQMTTLLSGHTQSGQDQEHVLPSSGEERKDEDFSTTISMPNFDDNTNDAFGCITGHTKVGKSVARVSFTEHADRSLTRPVLQTPMKMIDSSMKDLSSTKSPRRKSHTPRRRDGPPSVTKHALPSQPSGTEGNHGNISSADSVICEESRSVPISLENWIDQNKTLMEKLAENINKVTLVKGHTSGCSKENATSTSVSSQPATVSELQREADISVAELDSFLEMPGDDLSVDAVNGIIEMTRNDAEFDALFKLFNVDKHKFIEQEYGVPPPSESTGTVTMTTAAMGMTSAENSKVHISGNVMNNSVSVGSSVTSSTSTASSSVSSLVTLLPEGGTMTSGLLPAAGTTTSALLPVARTRTSALLPVAGTMTSALLPTARTVTSVLLPASRTRTSALLPAAGTSTVTSALLPAVGTVTSALLPAAGTVTSALLPVAGTSTSALTTSHIATVAVTSSSRRVPPGSDTTVTTVTARSPAVRTPASAPLSGSVVPVSSTLLSSVLSTLTSSSGPDIISTSAPAATTYMPTGDATSSETVRNKTAGRSDRQTEAAVLSIAEYVEQFNKSLSEENSTHGSQENGTDHQIAENLEDNAAGTVKSKKPKRASRGSRNKKSETMHTSLNENDAVNVTMVTVKTTCTGERTNSCADFAVTHSPVKDTDDNVIGDSTDAAHSENIVSVPNLSVNEISQEQNRPIRTDSTLNVVNFSNGHDKSNTCKLNRKVKAATKNPRTRVTSLKSEGTKENDVSSDITLCKNGIAQNALSGTLLNEVKGISPHKVTRTSPNKVTKTSPNKVKRTLLNKETRASPNKVTRTSPNKVTRTSPNKEKRTAPNKVKWTALNKETRASPNKVTRTSPNKEKRTVPNKETRTSPNKVTRTSPNKEKRTVPNKETRASPKKVTRTSPNKEKRTAPNKETRTSPNKEKKTSQKKVTGTSGARGRSSKKRKTDEPTAVCDENVATEIPPSSPLAVAHQGTTGIPIIVHQVVTTATNPLQSPNNKQDKTPRKIAPKLSSDWSPGLATLLQVASPNSKRYTSSGRSYTLSPGGRRLVDIAPADEKSSSPGLNTINMTTLRTLTGRNDNNLDNSDRKVTIRKSAKTSRRKNLPKRLNGSKSNVPKKTELLVTSSKVTASSKVNTDHQQHQSAHNCSRAERTLVAENSTDLASMSTVSLPSAIKGTPEAVHSCPPGSVGSSGGSARSVYSDGTGYYQGARKTPDLAVVTSRDLPAGTHIRFLQFGDSHMTSTPKPESAVRTKMKTSTHKSNKEKTPVKLLDKNKNITHDVADHNTEENDPISQTVEDSAKITDKTTKTKSSLPGISRENSEKTVENDKNTGNVQGDIQNGNRIKSHEGDQISQSVASVHQGVPQAGSSSQEKDLEIAETLVSMADTILTPAKEDCQPNSLDSATPRKIATLRKETSPTKAVTSRSEVTQRKVTTPGKTMTLPISQDNPANSVPANQMGTPRGQKRSREEMSSSEGKGKKKKSKSSKQKKKTTSLEGMDVDKFLSKVHS